MKPTRKAFKHMLPKPKQYFGHSTLSPMYTKEELISFASAIYAIGHKDGQEEMRERIGTHTEKLELLSASYINRTFPIEGETA